jgi:predicted DNA-binding transcriptional regulator AlpA
MTTNEPVVSNKPALLEDFLSESEVAGGLEVSVQTLRRWGRQGRGPKRCKIGKAVRYSRAAVRVWLDGLAGDDAVAVKRAQTGLRNARRAG